MHNMNLDTNNLIFLSPFKKRLDYISTFFFTLGKQLKIHKIIYDVPDLRVT